MKIKIIGEDSSNRMKLLKNLNKALRTVKPNIELEIIDYNLEKFHHINKPILMINEKIISSGRVLTDREIKNYIKLFA